MDSVDEDSEVLAAEEVYVLLNNERRVSRDTRAQWFLRNLNRTISLPRRQDLAQFREELAVVSILPKPDDVPDDWDSDTSHLYQYRMLPSTSVTFLARKYRFVFCLDFSSSSACVNLNEGEVMHATAFVALRRCLEGMIRPFFVPGSEFLFLPKVYITILAYLPFQTMSSEQVLVQGWAISERSLDSVLTDLYKKLHRLEDQIADETGVFIERCEKIKVLNERLTGALFDDVSDRCSPRGQVSPQPSESRESALVELLRLGLLSLQLLPDNSSSHIVVITDGVNCTPDMGLLDPVLTQLRMQAVPCSFVHVLGGAFQPQQSVGLLPYSELLEFVASSTSGTYIRDAPALEVDYQRQMNIYHHAFYAWSFHKRNIPQEVKHACFEDEAVCSSSVVFDPSVPTYRSIANPNFPDVRDHATLRKSCLPANRSGMKHALQIELCSILSSRLREGFAVRDVTFKGDQITITLMYAWKPYVTLEYVIIAAWPDVGESVVFEMFVQGDYDFVRDITYGKKFVLPSPYRRKGVSRFWNRLKLLAQADQLLVLLNSFASNPANLNIPETLARGIPLFAVNPRSTKPVLFSSDFKAPPNFTSFWKPIAMMEPALWRKWMHTWRMGLLLEHDRPLPASKSMHQPSSSGHYEPAPCRQAAHALSTLLGEWATFVLVENVSYVKLIQPDTEKAAVGFCLLKVTSKTLYVILRLAFLGGTPGDVRHQEVTKLREKVLHLSFPVKPATKRTLALTNREMLSLRASMDSGNNGVGVCDNDEAFDAAPRTQFQIQMAQHVVEDKVSPPLQRCCVELWKPLDKILVRYERVPADFFSPPPISEAYMSFKGKSGSLKPVAALWRYLYHRRWIWAAQSSRGFPIPMAQIVQILATITEMRLEEGFHFAFFSSGIFTMVREVQMKVLDIGDLCPALSGGADTTLPCTVQYVVFPPHVSATSRDPRAVDEVSFEDGGLETSEEGSDEYGDFEDEHGGEGEDEGEGEGEGVEPDGELQLVTECWVEPQIGTVVDPHPYHFARLVHEKIPDEVFKQDLECISTLITMAHLSLMCQNPMIPSPSGQLTPSYVTPEVGSPPEIQYVPFCFDITRLLPKCQQVELLFSTLIEDLGTKLNGTPKAKDGGEALLNQHFFSCIFAELRQITDREVTLNPSDWAKFPALVRLRDRPWEKSEPPFECPALGEEENAPKWRSFVKGVSSTHLLLIILPASQEDLLKLMIPGGASCRSGSQEKNTPRPSSKFVRFVVEGVDDVADTPTSRTASFGEAPLPPPCGELLELEANVGRSYSLGSGPATPVGPRRVRAKSGSGTFPRSPSKPNEMASWARSVQSVRADRGGEIRPNDESSLNRSYDSTTAEDSIRSSLEGVFLPDQSLLPESRKFWAGVSSSPSSTPAKSARGGEFEEACSCDFSFRRRSPLLDSVVEKEKRKSPRKRPRPVYASVVLPIYVYDCPLSGMIGSLASRHEARAREKDEFHDHTYKFSSELPEGNEPIRLSRESSENSSSKESHPERNQTLPKKEVKFQKGLTRGEMCETIELCVLKSFVSSVFKCLQLRLPVHAQDVLAAVERCQSIPIELDLTDFLQEICHHVKRVKATNTNLDVPASSKKAQNVPLSSLKTMDQCECAVNLHAAIKVRFLEALQGSFLVVPSHPQYFFFCPPGWGRRAEETSGGPTFEDVESRGDLDSSLNKSDTVIFRSDIPHGGNEGSEARGRGSSIGADEHRTSLLSNVDSLSHLSGMEDSADEASSQCGDLSDTRLSAPPLFLHLLCTAKAGPDMFHCPVTSLPVCLGEIFPCVESFGPYVNLDKVKIRLDVLCLTLPPIILATLSKRCREGLRSTSFCSGASTEFLETWEMTTGADDQSDASSVIENIDAVVKSERLLGTLPGFQKQSITDTVDEIKWLLKDEMVSSLLDNEIVDVASLEVVCEHVSNSNGRASCIYQEVPLEFVCSRAISHDKFVQKLKEFRVGNYTLRTAGDFYFISRVKSSDPALEPHKSQLSRTGSRFCGRDLTSVRPAPLPLPPPPRLEALDDSIVNLSIRAVKAGVFGSYGPRRAVSEPQSPVKRVEQQWKHIHDTSCSDFPLVHNREFENIVRAGVLAAHRTAKGMRGADDTKPLCVFEDKYRLPGFWLILRVDKERVETFFHCRSGCEEIQKVANWRKIYHEVIAEIKATCKVVNQILLLQDLHDTRVCNQLLEPEAPEDIWAKEETSSGSDSETCNRRPYPKERSPDDGEPEKPFLEANLRMKPGEFACGAVLVVRFYLHPRLKTPGVKTGAHRAVTVLQGVLSAFSVNNRRNMFVYQDRDDNVYYLRLHEYPATKEGGISPGRGALGNEEAVDDSGRSRSFSYGSAFPRRNDDHEMAYEVVADPHQLDKDRGVDDFLVLVVHGVTEASSSIKVELVEMLRKRLNEAVLDVISVMLLRNPQCKLRPEDVRFIQPPHEPPAITLKLCIPVWSLPYLPAVHLYLRQNLVQFLFQPRYVDARPENHFVDCWDDPFCSERDSEPHDGDLFLYLLNNNKPGTGADGIACVSLIITNAEGFRVVWNVAAHTRHGRLCFAPLAMSPTPAPTSAWSTADFESVVQVKEYVPEKCRKTPGSDSSEADAEDREVESFLCRGTCSLVVFRVWKQGKIDMDLLKTKLTCAVRQSVWDLYSEHRVFLPSPLVDDDSSLTVETFSEPTTPVKFPRRSSVGGLSVSHPPGPSPSPVQVNQGSRSPLKSQLSLAEAPAGGVGRGGAGERFPGRTAANLSESSHPPPSSDVLENVFLPWLEFGVSVLGVPSVKRSTVHLASRQNMDTFVRELDVVVEGMDEELDVWIVERPREAKGCVSELRRRKERRKVERTWSHTQTPSTASRNESPCSADFHGFMPLELIPAPAPTAAEGDQRPTRLSRSPTDAGPCAVQEFYLFGRRTRFWKNSQFCIPEQERSHSGSKGHVRFLCGGPASSPAVTPTPTPSAGQIVCGNFQPTSILAGQNHVGSTSCVFSSPDPNKFVVTRQSFIYVTVKDKDVSIYTYNWSRDLHEQLLNQAQKLTAWLNSRTRLLHSIVYQKMGLFHCQPITRVDKKEKECSKVFQDIDGLIRDPRIPSRDGSVSGESHRHNSGSSFQEDPRPPRPISGPGLLIEPLAPPTINLSTFLTIHKDARPRVPLHMASYGQHKDVVTRHGKQLQDLRRAELSDADRKQLVQTQTRDAHANLPLNLSLMQHLCSSMARPIHYVYTPVLFLPRWRAILASIRDHSAVDVPAEEHDVGGVNPSVSPPGVAASSSNPALILGFPPPAADVPTTVRLRHNSGQNIVVSQEPRLSLTSTPRFGPMSSPLRGPSVDETWHDSLILTYVQEYVQYLQSLGFIFVQAKPAPAKARKVDGRPQAQQESGPRIVVGGGGSARDPVSIQLSAGSVLPLGKMPPQFLLKSCVGGIIVIEVGIDEPYAYAKMYALERSRLQPKNSSQLSRQHVLSFVDECDKIMFMHHMHSFTYDYHLRALHAYLSGRRLLFRHGYHLTACLDDFIKYYTKGPNFARNLIHAGSMVIENTYTPGTQLYNYLMNHCEKIYDMRVVRMSPMVCGVSGSVEAESEYVLIKLSTHLATYKDANEAQQTGEFDLTVVIALENENWDGRLASDNFVALKFYVILTNKRDLYPKLAPARVGKFRTVSVPSPSPIGKAGSLSGSSLTSSSAGRFRDPNDSGSDKSATATPPAFDSTPNSMRTGTHGSWTITRPSTVRQKSHKGYMGIKVESVHYTGFFSSYEEAMQQILVDQVRQAQSKIRQVVQKAMIHCRRDALWEMLEAKPGNMTMEELKELLSLVVVRPLIEIDPNLAPLYHMSSSWFCGLARLLVGRYQEDHRSFCAPADGSQTQCVVALNGPGPGQSPKTCFAFLIIDHVLPAVELAIGYKEPIEEEEFRATHPPERVATVIKHMEEFVDLCCFHLWSGIVTKL